MKNILLLLVFSFAFIHSKAQTINEPCPNLKKLRAMCMFIGSRTEIPNPKYGQEYMFEERFYEAACVDVENDSPEEIGRKISALFRDHGDILVCDNLQFDLSKGSLIKWGVATKFDYFIYKLIKWKVDFNRIDPYDQGTVLDYITSSIKRNKGLASERVLQNYYRQIREAGGKHGYELGAGPYRF